MPELDLQIRSQGFGCSELGAVFGVDPFVDLHALYVKKFDGVVEPPTRRMAYGHYFEEAILHAAAEETGIPFQPSFNKSFRHPQFSKYHLSATPDGLTEDPGEGGVECKLAGWDQKTLWGPPDDAVPLIPPRVELQVRGTMEVLDRPRWHIAVWCGSDKLLIYTVERDRQFGQFILRKAEEAWRKYFETRQRPPIGANKISTAWLQRAYPKHKSPDIRPATDEEIVLLTRYGDVRDQQAVLKKERILIENQLKDALKEREGMQWPEGLFTWKRTRDSTWINWEAMAIGLRNTYIKDPDPAKQEEMRATLTGIYTNPKPGSRRIRFVDKREEEADTEEEADAA